MKQRDPMLAAWEKTLARKSDAGAILTTTGEVLRTFQDVEKQAHAFAGKIDIFRAGQVVAIQIGNHEDWPSLLLACWRRHLVVLPLEQSMSSRERDAALEICKAAGSYNGQNRQSSRAELGRESAIAPQINLRNNGRAARDSVSRRTITRGLRPDFPDDGHFRCRS
jgi:acyl-CoA synthetase (AMP-forming)/AMP-acid ligase II